MEARDLLQREVEIGEKSVAKAREIVRRLRLQGMETRDARCVVTALIEVLRQNRAALERFSGNETPEPAMERLRSRRREQFFATTIAASPARAVTRVERDDRSLLSL